MRKILLCALLFVGSYFFIAPQNALAEGGGCAGYFYVVSIVGYNTSQNYVYGYEAMALDYYLGICFDPQVSGVLDPICSPNGEGDLDYDEDIGFADWIPAEVFLSSNNYQPNTYYTSLGDFFLRRWYNGQRIYQGYVGVCIRTPPICTPFDENGTAVPCPIPSVTPTPTPTPTPPAITISSINIVEKYGEETVTVNITNNPMGTTNFTLRTTNGTGSATFENGTNEVIINGNATNQQLRIRGITESSAADNITIEAKANNRPTVLAHDEFTVAVITSLEFERINMDDEAFNNNPGTDGIVNPDGSEGLRIYPDRNNPTDGTDRSIIRVNAEVSPSVPNVKVYFASFDLDDPSATGLPIDTTGNNGNDNNGAVNSSKSGEFIAPTGSVCTAVTTASDVSQIGCDVAGKSASTNYKVTMQPGDNFAVAASFSDTYRDGIRVNSLDGSKLINSANLIIPISGTSNPDNIAGLRTKMLTNWRKLHIEVDSMGAASGNKVEGNLTDTKKVSSGNQTLNLSVSNLRVNRFENGTLVIKRGNPAVVFKTLRVRATTYVSNTDDTVVNYANTASSVTVFNNTGVFSVSPSDSFILYDDDDVNDDGVLDGDEGDTVPEPDRGLLQSVDTPCPSAYTANNCNVFASAYVRPEYDLTGNQRNVTYFANRSNTEIDTLVQTFFQAKSTEASEVFWTIYLLGAYQQLETDSSDPDRLGALYGVTGTLESTIFEELARATEYEDFDRLYTSVAPWRNRSIGKRFTSAHEVGHLFGCDHMDGGSAVTDYGVMGTVDTRTTANYNDYSLNIIRKRRHP